MWIFAYYLPRDLPMLCGPFFFRAPLPPGCALTLVLSRPKQTTSSPTASCSRWGRQPLENAAFGTAAEPGVDRRPTAEPLRQGAPLAVVLYDVQYCLDEDDVRGPRVPALIRQKGADFGAMFRRDLFHNCAPLDFYLIVDRHLYPDQSRTKPKS